MEHRKRENHGLSKTPEYRVWTAMIRRCHNPIDKSYRWYGARGITVCKSWRRSFLCFIRDIGLRPKPDLTLERRNGNLGYGPANCCWATWSDQRKNMRTRRVDITGKRFGKLTVVRYVRTVSPGRAVWLCRCDCGKLKELKAQDFARTDRISTRSCGCLLLNPVRRRAA